MEVLACCDTQRVCTSTTPRVILHHASSITASDEGATPTYIPVWISSSFCFLARCADLARIPTSTEIGALSGAGA
jgi:hypothetical protein